MPVSLKLPPELKVRVDAVAEASGRTPHAFMVEAIARETERAELLRAFIAEALASREDFERDGLGYAADEVHAYLSARAQGKKVARPKARQLRK